MASYDNWPSVERTDWGTFTTEETRQAHSTLLRLDSRRSAWFVDGAPIAFYTPDPEYPGSLIKVLLNDPDYPYTHLQRKAIGSTYPSWATHKVGADQFIDLFRRYFLGNAPTVVLAATPSLGSTVPDWKELPRRRVVVNGRAVGES